MSPVCELVRVVLDNPRPKLNRAWQQPWMQMSLNLSNYYHRSGHWLESHAYSVVIITPEYSLKIPIKLARVPPK